MGTAVKDWATDYDIFDPGYVANPFGVWDDLRQKCPVAHTDRWGGSWLPTRYEDVFAIARDVERFSSTEITVAPTFDADDEYAAVKSPPISSDPPEHTWARRLILPLFAPKAVERFEPATRQFCRASSTGSSTTVERMPPSTTLSRSPCA